MQGRPLKKAALDTAAQDFEKVSWNFTEAARLAEIEAFAFSYSRSETGLARQPDPVD